MRQLKLFFSLHFSTKTYFFGFFSLEIEYKNYVNGKIALNSISFFFVIIERINKWFFRETERRKKNLYKYAHIHVRESICHLSITDGFIQIRFMGNDELTSNKTQNLSIKKLSISL